MKEQRNLAILNHLKHPNIVQLFSSYTHRNKHHFLFPLLGGGDLAKFLVSEARPPAFATNQTFYTALCGLASALESIHDFTTSTLDLKLMGCHHDLNPRNVLVDGNKFVLADFGLSTFKSRDEEESKTNFKMGKGFYLAPECEDFENNFEKLVISRPSDIWSFGCMTADVLTYMMLGREGVENFRIMRKVKITPQHSSSLFHGGRSPNPGVEAWFANLEGIGTTLEKRLIQLARTMLEIKPELRPKARAAAATIRFLAVNAAFNEDLGKYITASDSFHSLDATIELLRFKTWGWALGLVEINGEWNTASDIFNSEIVYGTTMDKLSELSDELDIVAADISAAQGSSPRHPLFLELRLMNDQIVKLLPYELRERTRGVLQLQVLNHNDLDDLPRSFQAFEISRLNQHIGMLATIRRMHEMTHQSSKDRDLDLHLDAKLVHNLETFRAHHTGWVFSNDCTSRQRVLVEWIPYDTHWEGPVAEELFSRVETIAELLNSASTNPYFHVLHCSGFFHEPLNHRFGLVHNFPIVEATSQESIRPVTLTDILEDRSSRCERPTLGDRLHLAQSLATCVLELHKVDWLHKNISSFNVAFFISPSTSLADSILDPYLIGFNHSRPNEPKAFTEGLHQDSDTLHYQHPEYVKAKRGFCNEFDFYSLGLVLLEIGLWAPIRALEGATKLAGLPLEELLEALLHEQVPVLGHLMGSGYRGKLYFQSSLTPT